MKYRNNLPVTTLLGAPALLVGSILAALSFLAVRTATDYFIPISSLVASLIVTVSAVGLILKRPGSRKALSLGLHAEVAIFTAGCIVYYETDLVDEFTTFAFVVVPIILILVCLHNQTVIEHIDKLPNNHKDDTGEEIA